MLQVTKEEAASLKEQYPDLFITITNRNSNHKKYYVEETNRVVNLIRKLRIGSYKQKS